MSQLPQTPNTPQSWYVYVDGQVYGPFDDPRMTEFFDEGRLNAGSVLSPDASGPFRPATHWPSYESWTRPRSETPVPTPTKPQAQSGAATHVLLVLAEIRSSMGMSFLQTLQSLGTVERVSNTVWLTQTGLSAAHAKSVLSTSLTAQDRLFIADVTDQKPESINLGASLDAALDQFFR